MMETLMNKAKHFIGDLVFLIFVPFLPLLIVMMYVYQRSKCLRGGHIKYDSEYRCPACGTVLREQ